MRGRKFEMQRYLPLVALYNEGLTNGEIARELGRTKLGVRSTVRRLREYGALPETRPQAVRIQWPVPRP